MSFLIYPREGDPMSGNGKAGNGRGNNRKRPFRRRDKDNNVWQEDGVSARGNVSERNNASRLFAGDSAEARKDRRGRYERPKWVPPKMNTDPLPVPDCLWCGKPIRDISLAIADKDTGVPVHFECVAARIAATEKLEKGDTITYIGGGRFGIVCFGDSDYPRDSQDRGAAPGNRDFRIKKIIEWEDKEKRAEWRSLISEHYSVT